MSRACLIDCIICGREAEIKEYYTPEDGPYFMVQCTRCLLKTATATQKSLEKVISMWNKSILCRWEITRGLKNG